MGKGIGIGPTLLLFALFGTVVTLPIYFYAIAWHKESTIRNESCEKIVSQVAFDMNSSIREAGLDKFLPENSPDSLILDYSYSRGERYLIAEGIEPVQLRQSV